MFGGSAPNYIYAGTRSGDTILTFPRAARALHFRAIAVNGVGTVAKFEIYEGGTLTATVPLVGAGNQNVPMDIDLSGYSKLSSVVITGIDDTQGIGWDDFTFDLQD